VAFEPLRVACIGMGWWSDVLADAIQRSGKLEILACYTRSESKRAAFAAKYGCRASSSFEAILDDSRIEAIVNTTPNNVHLETTRAAASAGKHVFLDKPHRQYHRRGPRHRHGLPQGGRGARPGGQDRILGCLARVMTSIKTARRLSSINPRRQRLLRQFEPIVLRKRIDVEP